MKRVVSIVLAVAILVGMLPATAWAAGDALSAGCCEHHQTHDDSCGYKAAAEGSDCTHQHTADCYEKETCIHTHGEECSVTCSHVCSTDNGCITMQQECVHLVHDAACGGLDEENPVCNHICKVNVDSEESCYALLCAHAEPDVHDEVCGYVETVAEKACEYICEECAMEEADATAVAEVKALIDAIPALDVVREMSQDEQKAVYEQTQAAYDAYEKLKDEQKAELLDAEATFDRLFAYFNSLSTKIDIVESGSCGENLTWILDSDGILTISGNGEMYNFDYNESPWYSDTRIKQVILENGVTSIGATAFWNCKNIVEVIISDSISTIKEDAFLNCVNLKKIEIPKSVIQIDFGAFSGCLELVSITIHDDNPRYCDIDDIVYNKELTELVLCPDAKTGTVVIPDGITTIADSAFDTCTALSNIVIPKSVTIIEDHAFHGCSNLAELIIPDSVEQIGGWAFLGCSGLVNLTIPNSVTEIGNSVFSDCSGLVSITLPENFYGITSNMFRDCSKLSTIKIPDSAQYIADRAFQGCTSLTSITIPDNINSLGGVIFAECDNLKSVIFEGDAPKFVENTFEDFSATVYYPNSNTTWIEDIHQSYGGNITWVPIEDEDDANNENQCGDELFWNFDADTKTLTISGKGEMYDFPDAGSPWYSFNAEIDHVVISEGATSIGNYAFVSCGMDDIEIPDSVTRIGQGAFALSSIESIKIPSGVTTIEEYTFTRSSLNSVVLPERLKVIEENAFAEIPLTTIALPDTLTEIGAEAFWSTMLTNVAIPENVSLIGAGAFAWCEDLTSISVAAGNANYVAKSGILFDKNGTTLIQYPAKKNQETYAVPAGTSVIGAYAFSGAKALKKVELPGDMNALEECAFIGCSGLTEMNIPESVSSIGLGLLDNCRDLKNITFTGDAPFFAEHWMSEDMNLTAYYPADNETWTDEVKQNYGGKITWVVSCDHSLGDWYETKEPTEEAEGEERRDCEKCDYYETRSVEKLPTEGDTEETIGGTCGENLTWTLVDGTLTISGIGGMNTYEQGLGVPWYEQRETITSVRIEDGVTSIGSLAFYGCASLTSITIPDSVTSIGNDAFNSCDSLSSITIPDNVISIGSSAFWSCDSLSSITISDSVTSIGAFAFNGCASLCSITIPDSITSIGASAFSGCASLRSITIPDSVIFIDDSTFSGCASLSSITIPDSVISIGNAAFWNCDSLRSITIPDSVTYIGARAFNNCSSLRRIIIPNSVTYIGYYAFGNCTSLTDVYYDGSETQWSKISIDRGNTALTNATIHYNSTGPANGDTGNAYVRYFRKWDADTQTAYWGEEPPVVEGLDLGSQVTEETDTSFLADVDSLVGTYVLVETKPRDDGMIGPDILLSIKLVDTKIGTVASADENIIIIDGETYNTPDDLMFPDSYVGKTVRYYLYNGELISLEVSQSNDKAYDVVLNEYRDICSMTRDEYDSQYKESDYTYANQLMMRYYHIYGGMQIVYAFYDIDGNGVDELLIGNGVSSQVKYRNFRQKMQSFSASIFSCNRPVVC